MPDLNVELPDMAKTLELLNQEDSETVNIMSPNTRFTDHWKYDPLIGFQKSKVTSTTMDNTTASTRGEVTTLSEQEMSLRQLLG
jgi:hypothetical protein